jgi:hypothetical protein
MTVFALGSMANCCKLTLTGTWFRPSTNKDHLSQHKTCPRLMSEVNVAGTKFPFNLRENAKDGHHHIAHELLKMYDT